MAMQQDRSSGLRAQPLRYSQPAMSVGEKNVNGFHENHDAESIPRLGLASCATSRPTQRATHPEFRTEVAVCDVTVRGVLPGTAWPPMGSVSIRGDVRLLSCDEALELVDALLLVVTRMDVVAEERYSTTIDAIRDRED